MKCLHCGANHVRAVGPVAAIEDASRAIAAQYHEACGHDHEHDGHEGHEHNHGVVIVPGNDQFAYIKLPS